MPTPNSVTVWIEIPVQDLDSAETFHAATFGYSFKREEMGPMPNAIIESADGTVSGHLYPGKPAAPGTGPTVHLNVIGRLEDAVARCTAAGGTVTSPIVAIPPGRFVYARDPDGNSIGLFEAA